MSSNSYDLQLNKDSVIAITAVTPPLILITTVILSLGLRKIMPTERKITNLEWVGWNVGLFSGLALGMAISYFIAARGIAMGIINSNSGKGIDVKLLQTAGTLAGATVGLTLCGLSMFLLSATGRYVGNSFMPKEISNADEEAMVGMAGSTQAIQAVSQGESTKSGLGATAVSQDISGGAMPMVQFLTREVESPSFKDEQSKANNLPHQSSQNHHHDHEHHHKSHRSFK